MTAPRYEIHEADCPRLCRLFSWAACKTHVAVGHACPPCSGASMVAVSRDDLKELERLWRLHQAAPWPFRGETEPPFGIVASPEQKPGTISLIQVKDGRAVGVGRIENVRAETEEKLQIHDNGCPGAEHGSSRRGGE